MRFLINLLLMLVVALAIGFGLSWYALTDGRLFGAAQLGPWIAWPRAGSPAPDPYTRAYLARSGALQLGQGQRALRQRLEHQHGRTACRAQGPHHGHRGVPAVAGEPGAAADAKKLSHRGSSCTARGNP